MVVCSLIVKLSLIVTKVSCSSYVVKVEKISHTFICKKLKA